ncbi:hypothetical protein ATERTT37_000357 [Aspergillus terreus]
MLRQVIAGLVCRIVYRVLLHPLSKYPGPKLAAISNLPYIKWSVTGQLHSRIRELHERHGDVVRIRPNSLTFNDPQAWTDIYGHRKASAPPFRKDPEFYIPSSNGSTNLINSSEVDHARQKRLLTHAFSERSLRDQESLVMAYIDLFITRLGELANNSQDLDLLHWLNYLTFDIVGDLAFGEPFGCLKDSAYHPWVAILFQSIKTGALLRALTIYPTLAKIIRYFMPKSLLRKRADHYRLSKEMVTRRLDMDTTRPDFISYILKYNDERGMSRSEIEVNAALLIAAGSETTATTLSACVYYLQKNPECYKALTEEVRQAFSTDEEITFLAAGKLPYLNAIIEESLRMYPPAPAIGPRLVPEGGAVVNGEHIPGGVSVSVAHYPTFRSSSNFAEPDSFLPERWLRDKEDSRFRNDKREALQPFSYGPRACIGRNLAYAEMRTILSKLIWHFDITLNPRTTDWDNARSYIVWENKPLWVRLTPTSPHLSSK